MNEEQRKKLSESMRRYYKENPDKIPFRVWHYSKGESYPEKYFREWLENEGIAFEQQYAFETYNLDFLIGNIDLEIDGEQHFRTQKAIDRDLRRNQILEDNGFKIIRIRWSYYQKLTQEKKQQFLCELKEMLLNKGELPNHLIIKDKEKYNVRTKHIIINPEKQIDSIAKQRLNSKRLQKVIKDDIPLYCVVCGKPITCITNKRYCSRECFNKENLLKNVPTKEQLLEDYKTLTTCQIAEKYNTSHSNVGKWRKRYGIATPSRKKK